MPAKSAAQQKAAGAALATKRGETSPSKLKGASQSMYKSMSEKQLDEFASTKRRGKPEHVAKSGNSSRKKSR
jgi:2-methylcitrate dehydratase PrpD